MMFHQLTKDEGRCVALCTGQDSAYALFVTGAFVELVSLSDKERCRFKIEDDEVEYVMTVWKDRMIVCAGRRVVAVDMTQARVEIMAEDVWSRAYEAVGVTTGGMKGELLCVALQCARKGLVAVFDGSKKWLTSELGFVPRLVIGLETPCFAISDESQTLILNRGLKPVARIHGKALTSIGPRGLLLVQETECTWWSIASAAAPVPLRTYVMPADVKAATTCGTELWFIADGKVTSLDLTRDTQHSVPGSGWSQLVASRRQVWAQRNMSSLHEITNRSNETSCKKELYMEENLLEKDIESTSNWELALQAYGDNKIEAARVAVAVARYDFSGPEEAREALLSASRGVEYLIAHTSRDEEQAKRYLRDALVVVRDAADSVSCFERLRKEMRTSISAWGMAWLEFRRSDAMDIAADAAEYGAARSVRELWLRYVLPKCSAEISLGSIFIDRCLLSIEHLDEDKLLQLALRCIFLDDVLDTLDGGSLARLAAWAKAVLDRICLDENSFTQALHFGQKVITMLKRRLAVATESRWLLMSEQAYAEEEEKHESELSGLQQLVGRLHRLVELKVRHGLTLGSLDSYDEKASVAALLERVREPSFLEAEINHHVRPACQTQGINADTILAAYAASTADRDRAARVIRCGIEDQKERARAALDLIKRCQPPYPASVLELVAEYDECFVGQDNDPAYEESLRALRDAARLTALADLAARAGCGQRFDPTDSGHARRLLRRILKKATKSKSLEWLNDVKQLERAYPATISSTDAALLFFHFVLEAIITGGFEHNDEAPRRVRSAVLALVPRGQFRQSARRDMLLACLSQLDEDFLSSDSVAMEISLLHRRRAAARLGAAIAEDLAADNAPALGDDELVRAASESQEDDDVKARSQRALAEADAVHIDLMSRLAVLYEEFGLGNKVSPSLLSDAKETLRLLKSELPPLAYAYLSTGLSRDRLERLAELLDAPPGYVAATLVDASGGEQRYADELWRNRLASPTERALALRSLAGRLLHNDNTNVLEDQVQQNASSRRQAALRALTQAASLEPDLAVLKEDTIRLEALRFLDAAASRLAGAANHDDEDKLLILGGAKAAHGSAFERLFEAFACLVSQSSQVSSSIGTASSDIEDAIRALASAGAWRLAVQALTLSMAAREVVMTSGGHTLLGKHLESRLAYFHDAGHRQSHGAWLARQFQAEHVAGLAASSGGGGAVLRAYRRAVGAVSLSDLDALADLARLGAAVAQRLDDSRLRDATASLADDAKWWRRLRGWRVNFDHTKLRYGGGAVTASHARELLAPILTDDISSCIEMERVHAAYALGRRYNVPIGECAAAVAVRVLARGLCDRGHRAASILAKSSLDRIPDPQRRRTVLRAAIATAQPIAYDRIELAVKLLLTLEQQFFATAPVPEYVSGSLFAAPSADRLSKWKQLLRWLRSVKLDATAALGSQGSRLLGEGTMIGFHELITSPAATLERILTESTAPRLARIAKLCGLESGALWIRLAERILSEDQKNADDAWHCLERAAERNLPAAAIAVRTFIENGLVSDTVSRVEWTRRAVFEISDKWLSTSPRLAAALETRATLETLRINAARQAVADAFFITFDGGNESPSKQLELDDSLEASELIEKLYREAATAAAEAPRQTFLRAAQRAHAAARLLARFEAREVNRGDQLAEAARARLARSWIFDDSGIDDDQRATSGHGIFTPSAVELREKALELTAAKIAFVLSARDFGDGVIDAKVSALEARLLPTELPSHQETVRLEMSSAVDLLVDLAAAEGDHLDEGALRPDEAGRRDRLTASARLRALGAAAVLGPASSLRTALDRHGFDTTLPVLARRLKLVADLGALRLPILPQHAEPSAAVASLLADHGHDARLAPRLLPLLSGLLLDQACTEVPDLWRSLLERFAQQNLWRPLLTVFLRLSHQTWLHTWRGDGLRDLWLAAVRRPADELLEATGRKSRPLWDRNANKQRGITKHKKSPQLPADDLVIPVFRDVLTLVRAYPHFVRPEDKAHIVTALRAQSPSSAPLSRLAAAFEDQSAAADQDDLLDFSTPSTLALVSSL